MFQDDGEKTVSLPPKIAEEALNDLKCSICFGIPLKPKLTPCEHIFCEECIDQVLEVELPSCPNCRRRCDKNEVYDLKRGSFIYRIWCSAKVKCNKHEDGCSWTGSIIDYPNHFEKNHQRSEQLNLLKRRIEELEESESSANQKLRILQDAYPQLVKKYEENKEITDTAYRQLEEKCKIYKKDSRLDLPILYHGVYNYDRSSVVRLSQLISRYLENKPNQIDAGKIFNCVKKCYSDMERNYSDNPKHYRVDMRMLLSTCYASTWFTNRQINNISQWLTEKGWM
eukprot:CAMPEP_0197826336 /NCGR_PEP_ID=MMETSP1437-20131217/3313_1 /TAXON_ID=49252 ORGANISM="Eucampia antarctica, Strain CCMP1452" /NCGR_SAMPLE_ID=MMETSP1437 /ASSEMBLY_ACC=CAM_ASM_001096 /LENGTH=282 /DNA_ID=CAMNT_0043426733 /DNA_START=34 /DNA_END=882 /DNA_ORIENTATION=+